jgi:HlyD family secretion protein
MLSGWRRWVAVALVLAVAVGIVWWLLGRGSGGPVWQGYAEADYVKVAPVQQGLLTAIQVARGDHVTKGQPLFDQDETPDRAGFVQAARQLAEAQNKLANLEAGGKPTEIEQAKASLAEAQSTLARTDADFRRNETLVRRGAVSLKSLDQARSDYQSAVARVEAAKAALQQMEKPLGRTDEIRAQRDAVDAARALLDMAKWRLDQRHVAAPIDGRVADVIAQPGETMAAGAPVVSLLPPENIFVRFFVPEAALASLHRGDAVTLACDNCPAGLTAAISFISPKAEYSPPVIYSESSRAKLVYLIEARPPPDKAALLNPGQPVEVRPVTKDQSK